METSQSQSSTSSTASPSNSIDDQFVNAIIREIAPLNPTLNAVQLAELVGRSSKKTNDYTIMVAKLNKYGKLPGNPAAIAADWVSKVMGRLWN